MSKVKELNVKHDIKKKRYWVSSDGKIYWKDRSGDLREMRPFTTRDGYVEYVLTTTDGTKQHLQAQIAVLATFKGYSSNKAKSQANHKDGDRTNNIITNLNWMSPKENINHSFKVLGKKGWNSNSYTKRSNK